MKRQLLIMLVVLSSLFFWERRLARQESHTRHAAVRIQRLVSPELFKDRPIAALQLEAPDGKTFFYAHRQGIWRCLSLHGAVALTPQIQTVLRKVIEARGVVQSQVSEYSTNLTSFGLGSSQRWRLALCGSKVRLNDGGDVIFALDLGSRISGTGGSYVRPVSDGQIWAIDEDLREELEREPGSNLPPLLDPHLVPLAWPGWQSGLRRIVLERPQKKPLHLVRRDKERTEAEQRTGLPPWDWIIREGESEKTADARQAYFYSQFLLQAPYAGLLPPKQREELGLDKSQSRIRLEAVTGQNLELFFGAPTIEGRTPVLNTFSQSLYEVDREIIADLFPEAELLVDASKGNPWEGRLNPGVQ
jgi:hypothetical protein